MEHQTLYDYCIENKDADLLTQWDVEANFPLTPKTVSYGSSRMLHWICKEGHRWTTKAFLRTTHRSGCPVCAKKKVCTGKNDLQTLYPELADEWDWEKNGVLRPSDVSPNSHLKAWWRCPECGYEWLAAIKSRAGTTKCGCPACAGRAVVRGSNDLASILPELANEWHPIKNGTLTPRDVTAGTTRKVWWRCKAGHEWQATVLSRTSHRSGCPVCAGKKIVAGINDLASHYPRLVAEWDEEANGALTPFNVSTQSNRKVWWRCERGHSYLARVADRTAAGRGCPYCTGRRVLKGFNDLLTLEPKIAAEWHPTLNEALSPDQVTVGSRKKVWWQCADGHIWKSVIYSRTGPQKTGCPVCAGRISKKKLLRYAAAAQQEAVK